MLYLCNSTANSFRYRKIPQPAVLFLYLIYSSIALIWWRERERERERAEKEAKLKIFQDDDPDQSTAVSETAPLYPSSS